MRTIALLLWFGWKAWACSCVAQGVQCEVQSGRDLVFVGTVLGPGVREGDFLAVRFQVEEPLAGEALGERVIYTPSGGSAACGIEFRVGQRWLIRADSSGGKFHVNLCGASRLASKGDREALLLGELLTGRRKPFIYGVTQKSGDKVVLESGGLRYEAFTNKEGRFEFEDLKPGKYRVQGQEVELLERSCLLVRIYLGQGTP